ncbi:vascular endothelial growth factor Ab isoform 1 precursor [Danio rerio]|uniref:Vascular endothelial growth factor Ab isoform 1 precursor n=1 Tax=Danio rerio TaxID=7955 RepID=A0A8M1P9F8_DANRE|nr:vascular endothelial growth factor Ab isoform 1 precursor [Danio rerio]|eukprot:NP_001315526.1 vascular endothelial growth factor A isoform 1 precursor [Danio rerio]
MNFAVRVLQLFIVTLLYFSAVKSAYIPREGGRSTYDVVPFMEVYNKSLCRPREMLVEIQQEYPDDTEHIFIPSCVVLTRCAGCCNDEMMECTPTVTYNITLEIKRLKPLRHQGDIFMSFAEHSECQCRMKKDLPKEIEKKPRKGKGQKRKGKKNREKKRDLCMAPSCLTSAIHTLQPSLWTLRRGKTVVPDQGGSKISQCEPCCSTCSERRRRLFVQDPETCQCSCKHSEADCRSRQLELNERTCRCDKPRR